MNYALVGVFVLVLGALLIAGVLWLASGGLFQNRYDFYLAIVNESVSGLNLNAPVKYSGVEVGKVESIKLDPENSEQVRLIFAIERGTQIKADTVAMLKTQGLTGIAHVELSGGTRSLPPLTSSIPGQYPEIQTKPSFNARLENVLTMILSKLDSTSNSINDILSDENKAAFKNALADIATVAHAIAGRKEEINKGIADAAGTFANISAATKQLDQVIESIGISAKSIEEMGNEVAHTSASAGTTVNEIGADMKRFTGETLPELERLLGELNSLAASLRRLSEQTIRNPSGILFGRTPVTEGPGESTTGSQPP